MFNFFINQRDTEKKKNMWGQFGSRKTWKATWSTFARHGCYPTWRPSLCTHPSPGRKFRWAKGLLGGVYDVGGCFFSMENVERNVEKVDQSKVRSIQNSINPKKIEIIPK